jgi:hypothetical protein
MQSIRDKTESAIYNHSGLLYKGENGWYVVELGLKNSFSGLYRLLNATVIFTPLEDCLKAKNHDKIIILKPKATIDSDKFEEELMKYTGTGYDYSNLLLHQPILKLTGLWIGRNKNTKFKMICNELTMTVWNELRGYFPNSNRGDIKNIYHSEFFRKM